MSCNYLISSLYVPNNSKRDQIQTRNLIKVLNPHRFAFVKYRWCTYREILNQTLISTNEAHIDSVITSCALCHVILAQFTVGVHQVKGQEPVWRSKF